MIQTELYLGIMKGHNTPSLPHQVDLIYNHIYFRIFRVIGGIAFLLIITGYYNQFPFFFNILFLY